MCCLIHCFANRGFITIICTAEAPSQECVLVWEQPWEHHICRQVHCCWSSDSIKLVAGGARAATRYWFPGEADENFPRQLKAKPLSSLLDKCENLAWALLKKRADNSSSLPFCIQCPSQGAQGTLLQFLIEPHGFTWNLLLHACINLLVYSLFEREELFSGLGLNISKLSFHGWICLQWTCFRKLQNCLAAGSH